MHVGPICVSIDSVSTQRGNQGLLTTVGRLVEAANLAAQHSVVLIASIPYLD